MNDLEKKLIEELRRACPVWAKYKARIGLLDESESYETVIEMIKMDDEVIRVLDDLFRHYAGDTLNND